MKFIRALYSVLIDALFPLSPAEAALACMTPEVASRVLPSAPNYDASVVPLPNTRSLFAYKDERVSKLVWSIKYKKNRHAVEIGGYALWKMLSGTDFLAARRADLDSAFILLPIPITPKRRRERGYNQCELILDEIQRLDTVRQFIYENRLLVRAVHKNRQTLKSRRERLENAADIFAIDPRVREELTRTYAGKKLIVIVIDDVITTGSTLKAALDTVKSAGFDDVRGLSLAH
jgi:ComF family protein